MLTMTKTAALLGIEGIPVTAEVDSSRGLPAFHVIGLGDTAVKEAADTVTITNNKDGIAIALKEESQI